ncbi:hypothetical protein BKH31_08295 [Actinomyces oris]|uniref:Uncharacterized protein n=1 Tax=Actinomyces oris TaxID=544580 RepID=A0A1Q8VCR5_9ACTO|nr:hypothetical protein [Actinomyces oris]OLO45886.1 hypothetical protein BKH31_08295 [Actinomyces oris]
MLVVVVLAVGWFAYTVHITLEPDAGPEGVKVRRIANAAEKHLSKNPNVVSTEIINASADLGGTEAYLSVRLKDDTSAEQVADLLASTHTAAFGKNSSDTHIYLGVSLSWILHGTSVSAVFDGSYPPDSASVRRVLASAGEARIIDNTGGRLRIDYGQVTALPTTLAQPGMTNSSKIFTLNGWEVTSISDKEGQFTNTPLEPVITAARQANATGTIDLDNGTLSVTGLVTDDTKDLTPEAAAPVIHAVSDCQAAGLTTLQLNNWASTPSNVHDPWLTFTCNNGTWTPHHGGSTGQDEATILNKAAEL